MTRGETRIMDELTGEWNDRWVGVKRLAHVLGYTRAFVLKTIERLYWEPPKGLVIARYKSNVQDWYYRCSEKNR